MLGCDLNEPLTPNFGIDKSPHNVSLNSILEKGYVEDWKKERGKSYVFSINQKQANILSLFFLEVSWYIIFWDLSS